LIALEYLKNFKNLQDTDHGKLSDTDHFISHAVISERNVFIVTDK